MCTFAHSVNEELSLPSRGEYFRPPPPLGMDVAFVPGLPRFVKDNVVVPALSPIVENFVFGLDLLQPLENVLLSAHQEPLFVEDAVATYVSRGRAYRGPAPSPSLPPRGHETGESLPMQGSAPQVGKGRASLVAFIRSLQNPGRSRD